MGTMGGIIVGFIIGGITIGGVTVFLQKVKQGTKDGALLFCNATQQYFVIQNGQKRLVTGASPTNVDPLTSLGYILSDAISLSCATINKIPTGPPIN